VVAYCLIARGSVVVASSSVGCWIHDPTGCLWRTRRFENKHEEEGGVNWKLLPAGEVVVFSTASLPFRCGERSLQITWKFFGTP
jgi:hypothetical protein